MTLRPTKRIRKSFELVIADIRLLLLSVLFASSAKKHPQDFTRRRKMPFFNIMTFMINQIKCSTQTALDRYFFGKDGGATQMSQQAFSKARDNIRWEACREIFDKSVSSVYEGAFSTWNGYRVLAIDGSKIQLPSDPKLKATFGTAGRGDSSPTAQSSTLYDVLNGIFIDAIIVPMSTGERKIAKMHIQKLATIPSFGKELLLADRGYPSFEMIQLFESTGVSYCMRLKSKFRLDIDRLPLGDHQYTLTVEGKSVQVRIVKFELPKGDIETLITNITDKRMGVNAFRKLYFMRWSIEVKYGDMKHKLEVENFSGRTETAIRQDYYITAFLSNMISIAAAEAQPVIDAAREDKDNKYDYNVNVNYAVGVFKDHFIMALAEPKKAKRIAAINYMLFMLSKHVTPVKSGRSVPRNPNPRESNFHHNQKSNC
jgi:hypothetical protein